MFNLSLVPDPTYSNKPFGGVVLKPLRHPCADTIADKFRRLIVGGYGDIDGDGVFETRTKLLGPIVDSEFNLEESYGCSCLQILEIKHGNNLGEKEFGCREFSLEIFIQKSGWAESFFS